MPIDSAKTVYLSFISTDLPVWKVIEGQAALYKKEGERFHLLLDGQKLPHSVLPGENQTRSRNILAGHFSLSSNADDAKQQQVELSPFLGTRSLRC